MNFIQYVKQLWKNGPSGGTPWSASRLNHMEDGIKANNDMISELNSNIANNKQVGTIEKSKSLQYSLNGKLTYALILLGGNIYLASTNLNGTATYITALSENDAKITCIVNNMTLILTNNTEMNKNYLIKII